MYSFVQIIRAEETPLSIGRKRERARKKGRKEGSFSCQEVVAVFALQERERNSLDLEQWAENCESA